MRFVDTAELALAPGESFAGPGNVPAEAFDRSARATLALA